MNGKMPFIEEMKTRLYQYQLQREERERTQPAFIEFLRKENKAKQALIELDNEEPQLDISNLDICRWKSNGLDTIKLKSFTQRKNFKQNQDRIACHTDSLHTIKIQNERSIPKLKNILQKLTTPIHKKQQYKEPFCFSSPKESQPLIEGILGRNTFVKQNKISKSQNKEMLKTCKEKNSENPFRISPHTQYQKIKRNPVQTDIIHEKKILSHILSSYTKQPNSINILTNLSNYFSNRDKKKN